MPATLTGSPTPSSCWSYLTTSPATGSCSAPRPRSDDRDPDVIERRLRRFHAGTEPLADHYRGRGVLTTVDAAQPPNLVTAAIQKALAT